MSLFTYKIIASVLIFLVSIAILYPLNKKHIFKHAESIELGEAFASGIFLGAAFFHMLPDAIRVFNEVYGNLLYPIPEVICMGGFLLFLFLERLSLANLFPSKNSIPYIVAVILIIHAFVEGAALGIGATFSEIIMLFVAIIAHKGSESFALCIILLKNNISFKRIIFIITFFATMTPLGILFGTGINLLSLATNSEVITASFNAFAAGTFLYISTLHHIQFHQHVKEKQGLDGFAFLAIGLIAMGLLALWV